MEYSIYVDVHRRIIAEFATILKLDATGEVLVLDGFLSVDEIVAMQRNVTKSGMEWRLLA